ncbi:hypothetical protein B0H12DRAFT_1149147, partial [Mycena haematopus]
RTPVYPLGGQIPVRTKFGEFGPKTQVPFEQKSSLRGDDARSGSNKKSALDKVGCHVFREQEQQVSVF